MPPENKFSLPTDLGPAQQEEPVKANEEEESERTFPFIHLRNKRKILALFSLIIIVSSAFTWVSLDTIDVRLLGRTYNIFTKEPFEAFLNAPDESQITITTVGTARVLVRLPNGTRIGDTVEGVRYADKNIAGIEELYSETATTSAIPKRQGFRLTLREPLSGRYQLHFSSPENGAFPYEVELLGRSGAKKRFAGQLSLNQDEEVEYILNFRKNLIPQSKLSKPGFFDRLFPN